MVPKKCEPKHKFNSKIYREELRTKKNPTEVFRSFVRSDGSTLTLEELGVENSL